MKKIDKKQKKYELPLKLYITKNNCLFLPKEYILHPKNTPYCVFLCGTNGKMISKKKLEYTFSILIKNTHKAETEFKEIGKGRGRPITNNSFALKHSEPHPNESLLFQMMLTILQRINM